MIGIKEIKEALLHLFYPQVCTVCGNDLFGQDSQLCMRCMLSLPETRFELHESNPVEKLFWGRLPLEAATAQFYFSKGTVIQQLMHQFKYKGNLELGIQLGRIMGKQILSAGRIIADAIVPLPLHPAKEKKRGYNQASILSQGISEILKIPVLNKLVERPTHTETQTKKGRIERWKNLEGKFMLHKIPSTENKHLLLIDDVITTGATLESCGSTLLGIPGSRLSIATLCIATR